MTTGNDERWAIVWQYLERVRGLLVEDHVFYQFLDPLSMGRAAYNASSGGKVVDSNGSIKTAACYKRAIPWEETAVEYIERVT